MHRYQLILPVTSNKIYQTNSLKKGAAKCYEELKSYGPIESNEFVILDIDTYHKYSYAITKQQGGAKETKETKDIKDVKETKVDIGTRVASLEQKYQMLESEIKDIKELLKENKESDRSIAGIKGAGEKIDTKEKIDIEVDADKLPTAKPETLSHDKSVKLPVNTGKSYTDDLTHEPNGSVKVSSQDIYRNNIKKLQAAASIEENENKTSKESDCVIQ